MRSGLIYRVVLSSASQSGVYSLNLLCRKQLKLRIAVREHDEWKRSHIEKEDSVGRYSYNFPEDDFMLPFASGSFAGPYVAHNSVDPTAEKNIHGAIRKHPVFAVNWWLQLSLKQSSSLVSEHYLMFFAMRLRRLNNIVSNYAAWETETTGSNGGKGGVAIAASSKEIASTLTRTTCHTRIAFWDFDRNRSHFKQLIASFAENAAGQLDVYDGEVPLVVTPKNVSIIMEAPQYRERVSIPQNELLALAMLPCSAMDLLSYVLSGSLMALLSRRCGVLSLPLHVTAVNLGSQKALSNNIVANANAPCEYNLLVRRLSNSSSHVIPCAEDHSIDKVKQGIAVVRSPHQSHEESNVKLSVMFHHGNNVLDEDDQDLLTGGMEGLRQFSFKLRSVRILHYQRYIASVCDLVRSFLLLQRAIVSLDETVDLSDLDKYQQNFRKHYSADQLPSSLDDFRVSRNPRVRGRECLVRSLQLLEELELTSHLTPPPVPDDKISDNSFNDPDKTHFQTYREQRREQLKRNHRDIHSLPVLQKVEFYMLLGDLYAAAFKWGVDIDDTSNSRAVRTHAASLFPVNKKTQFSQADVSVSGMSVMVHFNVEIVIILC